MRRLVLVAVLAFGMGVLVRDVRQDWQDKEREDRLRAEVRACAYYVILDEKLNRNCRPLMPRFEVESPIKNGTRWVQASGKAKRYIGGAK